MSRKIPRKLAGVVLALAGLIGTISFAPTASAHGALMIPGSRTFFCYEDGLTSTGQIVPQNPACQAAVAQSGTTPLYNWFAVGNRSGATSGGTVGFIPDGKLCSGNSNYYDFSGFDQVNAELAGHAPDQRGERHHQLQPVGRAPRDVQPVRHQGRLGPDQAPDLGRPGDRAVLDDHRPAEHRNRRDAPELLLLERHAAEEDRPPHHLLGVGALRQLRDLLRLLGRQLRRRHRPGDRHRRDGPAAAVDHVPGHVRGDEHLARRVPGAGHHKNTNTTPINKWTVGWVLANGETIASAWNGTLTQSGSLATMKSADWNSSLAAGATTNFGFVSNQTAAPTQPESLSCTSP